MQIIKTPTKEILTKSLFEYYKDLSRGDLQAQSHLMTDESYLIRVLQTLHMFIDLTKQKKPKPPTK